MRTANGDGDRRSDGRQRHRSRCLHAVLCHIRAPDPPGGPTLCSEAGSPLLVLPRLFQVPKVGGKCQACTRRTFPSSSWALTGSHAEPYGSSFFSLHLSKSDFWSKTHFSTALQPLCFNPAKPVHRSHPNIQFPLNVPFLIHSLDRELLRILSIQTPSRH